MSAKRQQRGRAGAGAGAGGTRPGFTMTEVLVSLFLASVGMVTVFGMQVAANVVQRQARDINAARMLGEMFLTRMRGETINWTSDLLTDCTTDDMPLCYAGETYGDANGWVAVRDANNSTSPRYNALGIPDDDADPRVVSGSTRDRLNQHNLRYCIHYRLEAVGTTVAPGQLLRAEVRVFWPMREDAFVDDGIGVPDCGFSAPSDMDAAERAGRFRSVQVNTVLYRHEPIL